MKTFTTAAVLSTIAATLAAAQCNCVHNNDAGRWIDDQSPASTVIALCQNKGCSEGGIQGNICIEGDTSQCTCLGQAAANWQSYHDDWFLWTSIQCDGLTMTMTG